MRRTASACFALLFATVLLAPSAALAARAPSLAELADKAATEMESRDFPVPVRVDRVELATGEEGWTGALSDRWHSSDAFEGDFREEFRDGLAFYLKKRGFDLTGSGEALYAKVVFERFEGRKRFHDDGGDLQGLLTLTFRGEEIARKPLFESLSYRDESDERREFALQYGLPRAHFATVLFFRLSYGFFETIEDTILAVSPKIAAFYTRGSKPISKGMDPAFVEPAGEETLLAADLATSEISIFNVFSSPDGAEIYLDGMLIATTPAEEVRIPAGKHRIRIRKAGYQDWDREVLVLEGNRLTLHADLVKSGG